MSPDSPIRKAMGDYENRPRCRQLSTLLPRSHLILAVSIEGARLPRRPRAPYSILTGTVDAGSFAGSEDASGRAQRQMYYLTVVVDALGPL